MMKAAMLVAVLVCADASLAAGQQGMPFAPDPPSGVFGRVQDPPVNQRPPGQPQPQEPPRAPGTPQAPQGPRESEPPRPPEPPGQPVNVLVEVTITDQAGTDAPDRKVVSLLAADGTFGRVRANGTSITPNGGHPVELNVDARPRLQPGGAIRLEVTLQYMPVNAPGADTVRIPTRLNQSLTVLLQDGKPLTVSRAADPATNRRVTVDLTATVVK